ncbi:catabolite repressor/activator, partial [Erwinia amylovora]|nr:catabolite repressor/activator [Erwinia amylovora]
DLEHFTSVVGADQEDAQALAAELRKLPAKSVLLMGALPELSVSFLRELGFRDAWKGDERQPDFIYANSFERSAAAAIFENYIATHDMPEALFTTSFG